MPDLRHPPPWFMDVLLDAGIHLYGDVGAWTVDLETSAGPLRLAGPRDGLEDTLREVFRELVRGYVGPALDRWAGEEERGQASCLPNSVNAEVRRAEDLPPSDEGPNVTAGGQAETLWSCDPYEDGLHCQTIDQAVEEWLDGEDPQRWSQAIVAIGWGRIALEPGDPDPEVLLEDVIQRLDEDYNWGDDPTALTAEMRAAAFEFARRIRELYVPWNCEETERREVPVAEWVLAHRRDWLDNPGVREWVDARRVPDPPEEEP